MLSIVNPNIAAADRSALDVREIKNARRAGRNASARICDDKILASWNGLMLGAFARASVVLGDEKYRAAAEKKSGIPPRKTLGRKIAKHFSTAGATANGTTCNCSKATPFSCPASIELYEATLGPEHLDFAIELAEAMIAKFYDAADGGFWQSPAGTSDLILRVKDDYDGAEPGGNSVATFALLKLAAITGREDFRLPVQATLQLFAGRLQNQPAALAFMLHALDFWLAEPRRVVIAGEKNSAGFQRLLCAAHSVYQPNKVILGNTGAVPEFARNLPAKNGAAAYLCNCNACQPPTNDPERLKAMLR